MPNANLHASNGVSVPQEAKSEGGINESTPAEQRTTRGNVKKSDGPVLNEKGAYAPAEYPVVKRVRDSEGKERTFTITRQDR